MQKKIENLSENKTCEHGISQQPSCNCNMVDEWCSECESPYWGDCEKCDEVQRQIEDMADELERNES